MHDTCLEATELFCPLFGNIFFCHSLADYEKMHTDTVKIPDRTSNKFHVEYSTNGKKTAEG